MILLVFVFNYPEQLRRCSAHISSLIMIAVCLVPNPSRDGYGVRVCASLPGTGTPTPIWKTRMQSNRLRQQAYAPRADGRTRSRKQQAAPRTRKWSCKTSACASRRVSRGQTARRAAANSTRARGNGGPNPWEGGVGEPIRAAGGNQSVGVGAVFRFGRARGGDIVFYLYFFYSLSLQSPVKIR